MTRGERVAAVLAVVAEAVARLSDRDIEDLLAGKVRLVLDAVVPDGQGSPGTGPAAATSTTSTSKPAPATRSRPTGGLTPEAAADLASEVAAAADRGAAEALLAGRKLTKADLLAVADAAGVSVAKSATVAKVRTMLVERLVGFRLRAEALRAGAPTR